MTPIVIFSAFLLTILCVLVTGAALQQSSETSVTELQSSSVSSVTGLQCSSDYSDYYDPDSIKRELYDELLKGNVGIVKTYIEQHENSLQKFCAKMFRALLECFQFQSSKYEECMEIFELLKPSFLDVSESRSSPLILALIYDNIEIIQKLLDMPEAENFVDKVDSNGRTAVFYASFYENSSVLSNILRISKTKINYGIGENGNAEDCEN